MARLAAIEIDLGELQNEYERAAGDRARHVRDWEKRVAIHARVTKGPNAEVRKASALAGAIEQDDLYEKLTDAEARYDAIRVKVKVLEVRTGIGQSILKAQGRT